MSDKPTNPANPCRHCGSPEKQKWKAWPDFYSWECETTGTLENQARSHTCLAIEAHNKTKAEFEEERVTAREKEVKIRAYAARLRLALEGMIGVTTQEDLEGMKDTLVEMAQSAPDAATVPAALAAINVLLEEQP